MSIPVLRKCPVCGDTTLVGSITADGIDADIVCEDGCDLTDAQVQQVIDDTECDYVDDPCVRRVW